MQDNPIVINMTQLEIETSVLESFTYIYQEDEETPEPECEGHAQSHQDSRTRNTKGNFDIQTTNSGPNNLFNEMGNFKDPNKHKCL